MKNYLRRRLSVLWVTSLVLLAGGIGMMIWLQTLPPIEQPAMISVTPPFTREKLDREIARWGMAREKADRESEAREAWNRRMSYLLLAAIVVSLLDSAIQVVKRGELLSAPLPREK